MKVVVTGATSFIGSVTVRQLLERGHEVVAVVRPNSKTRIQLERQLERKWENQLTLIELELMEISNLSESADGWIHIGWEGAGSDNRTLETVQQGNVIQTLESVRVAKKMGCKRFLFTGSQAEYGICKETTTEEHQLNPVSEYAKAKVQVGNLAKDLCKNLEIEYIHTRIFSVYGPDDHPWSLIQSCLRTWKQGDVMSLGPCTQLWNFLYIEDTASALVQLLEEAPAGTYNIASEDTRSLRDYIEEMYLLNGKQGNFVYGQRPPNAEGVVSLIPDITKIKQLTSWRPRTSFQEGIYETMHRM